MQASDKPFKEYWASVVHPAIKDDFERLLQTTPNRIAERQDKAEKAEKKKEKNMKKEKKEEETAPELPEDKKKDAVRTKIITVFEEAKERGERKHPSAEIGKAAR